MTEKEGTGNYIAKGKNPQEKDESIRHKDEKGLEGKENREGRKEKTNFVTVFHLLAHFNSGSLAGSPWLCYLGLGLMAAGGY